MQQSVSMSLVYVEFDEPYDCGWPLVSPLQGFFVPYVPTQDVALGSHVAAPLGRTAIAHEQLGRTANGHGAQVARAATTARKQLV